MSLGHYLIIFIRNMEWGTSESLPLFTCSTNAIIASYGHSKHYAFMHMDSIFSAYVCGKYSLDLPTIKMLCGYLVFTQIISQIIVKICNIQALMKNRMCPNGILSNMCKSNRLVTKLVKILMFWCHIKCSSQ